MKGGNQVAKLNLQGVEVKAARVLVGMKGHRPSGFNACIGAKMKDNTYTKPSEGMGGRHNAAVHKDFVEAAIACGANVSAAAKRKFGL
jgi:hypothetical protein